MKEQQMDKTGKYLYERIDNLFEQLTATQQQAAIYMKKNWENICVMTAKEVGEQSKVSEATIHRLAGRLGYESFLEMKNSVKENLMKNRALVNLELKNNTDQESWLEEYWHMEASNLANTLRMNEKDRLKQGAKAIANCGRVWIMGDKMGLGVSSYLHFVLNYLLGNATHLNLSNYYEHIAFMKEGDVLILVGFQRYCKRTLSAANLAKKRGVIILAFTDCSLSPFAKAADISYYAATESVFFLDSYSSVFTLAQALVVKLVSLDKIRIKSNVKNTEKIYENCMERNI